MLSKIVIFCQHCDFLSYYEIWSKFRCLDSKLTVMYKRLSAGLWRLSVGLWRLSVGLWVRGGYLLVLEGYLGGRVTWVNHVGGYDK